MTDQELYALLDVRCEHCGEKIEHEPDRIHIEDLDEPSGERVAYFCDDFCLDKWWNQPEGNPCTGGQPEPGEEELKIGR